MQGTQARYGAAVLCPAASPRLRRATTLIAPAAALELGEAARPSAPGSRGSSGSGHRSCNPVAKGQQTTTCWGDPLKDPTKCGTLGPPAPRGPRRRSVDEHSASRGAGEVAPKFRGANDAFCRPVAVLQTDGGTAFCWHGTEEKWRGELHRIVNLLQVERSVAEEARERRDGLRVELPLPRIPRESGQLTTVGAERRDVIDARLHGWPRLEHPLGDVQVLGRRREVIRMHFPDRAHVTMSERPDPDTGEVRWMVRVEAKARELYADGLRSWLDRWLGLWSWLLTGQWPDVRRLADAGWSTSQWHVNCDFVGFDLGDDDVRRFLGYRKATRYGAEETRRDLRSRGHTIAEGAQSCPWVQTLVLGRKTSDAQLVLYRKGDQLREAKRLDPSASMYAPVWQAHGWDAGRDGDPLRVELRLRKKGLTYVWPGRKDEVRWDFRDPSRLLDSDAVGQLWRYHTERRRLVLADTTRLKRSSTDPRWEVVQDAAGTVLPDMRQIPRKVRELTRRERIGRDKREALLAAVKLAARSGLAATDLEELGDVLVQLGLELQRGHAPELDVLPRELDLEAAAERAAESTQFFRDEADEAFEGYADELDHARGVRVERKRLFQEVEDDECE